MKKLYVTVSDEAYESLCSHIAHLSSEVVGISKSSVVDACLRSCLSRRGLSPDEYVRNGFGFIPLDCLRSVEERK